MLTLRALFGLWMLLLSISLIQSAENAPRKDLHGDPLPEGAIARMGISHLRHGGVDNSRGALSFSHDGKRLASYIDAKIRVWDVGSGKAIRSFPFSEVPAHGEPVALSPDGKMVIAVDVNGRVSGWNVDNGRTVFDWKDTGGYFSSFALGYLSNNTPVYTRSNDVNDRNVVSLYDAKSRKRLHTFQGDNWSASAADILPEGKTIISGSFDRENSSITVRFFDTKNFELKHTTKEISKDDPCDVVGVCADGSTIVTFADSGTIKIWDSATTEIRSTIEEQPQTANHQVPMGISWDGKRLAVSGWEAGEIRVYDTANGKIFRKLKGIPGGGHLTFSKDGKRLAHLGASRVQIWDVESGKELHSDLLGHSNIVSAVTFSKDGKKIASASEDGIRIWETKSSKHLAHWSTESINQSKIHTVLFSPDNKYLVSCGSGKTILWNALNGKPLQEWTRTLGEREVADFSPDGKTLFFVGADGEIEERDFLKNQIVRSFGKEMIDVKELVISPDQQFLAAGNGMKIRLWNIPSGREMRTIAEEGSTFSGLSFDTLSRYVLTTQNSTIQEMDEKKVHPSTSVAWDIRTKHQVVCENRFPELDMNKPFAISNRFLIGTYRLPEPNRIIFRVVDRITSNVRLQLPFVDGTISSLSISPNQRYVVTANADTTLLLWDLHQFKTEYAVPGSVTEEMVREQWEHLTYDYIDNFEWMIRVMTLRPEISLGIMNQQLKPIQKIAPDRLKKLVSDLEADRFIVRQNASKELKAIGEPVVDDLKRLYDSTESEDLRTRIEAILQVIDRPFPTGNRLRSVRAIEILERMGSEEAIRLLEKLASGEPQVSLTQEAKQALKRLTKS